jgi:hypothetical protein
MVLADSGSPSAIASRALGLTAEDVLDRLQREQKEFFELSDIVIPEGSGVTFQPMLSLCEIGTVQLGSIVVLCLRAEEEERQVFWPGLRYNAPAPTMTLRVLTTNLANTLISIRALTCSGFDGQARVLLRWFVELADLLLLTAADKSFLEQYVEVEEDSREQYQHWREFLAPTKVRDRLLRYETKLDLDPTVAKMLRDERESTYRWLSTFSHANWAGQVRTSHAVDVHGTGMIQPSIGGAITFDSRATLFRAISYAWVVVLQLQRLLVLNHGWKPDRSVADLDWFLFHSNLFVELCMRLRDEMEDTVEWPQEWEAEDTA